MTLFRGSGVTGTGTDVAFLRADNNLSDVDSASTSRSNLGLGSLATQPSTGVSITGGTITGITDLAVADGGTGSSTASGARTALGLVIGTDVQAWDAQLDDIAGLTPTDSNFIVGDGTNWVAESAGTARTSLGLGTSSVEDVGKTIGDVAQYEDDGGGNPIIDHPNEPTVNGLPVDKFGQQLLHVRDEKTSGTDGGTLTASTWNTRDLNTVLTNEITGASLASNQITLPAGTYYIEANSPVYRVNRNKPRLHNVTDASTEIFGESSYASSVGETLTRPVVSGRFTLAGTKDLELQHWIGTSNGTFDGGTFAGITSINEVYSEVRIWRVA